MKICTLHLYIQHAHAHGTESPTGDTSLYPQAMLGALEAIRGHKSAHSLATGPVTVEPGWVEEGKGKGEGKCH